MDITGGQLSFYYCFLRGILKKSEIVGNERSRTKFENFRTLKGQ